MTGVVHSGTARADVTSPVDPEGSAPADASKLGWGEGSTDEEKMKRMETARRAEEAMRQLLEGLLQF